MGLLQFIKKDIDVRKIFGKSELKIIEKQLLGINLTQSEKNRLSRDIRVKFDMIDKLSRFSDEFKLKKGSEIKKTVEDVKEVILNNKWKDKVRQIILYGSTIDNKRTHRSDIDIAVKIDKITLSEATRFRAEVSGEFSSKIDIQVYNFLPDKIKKEIDKNGRVIYERKNN